jgi:hypothetical protein
MPKSFCEIHRFICFVFIQIKDPILEVIENPTFWEHVSAIVSAFMPTLFLLRLADRNIPAMDQLYFYVRKMDSTIDKVKDILETIEKTVREGTSTTGTLSSRDILKFYLCRNKTNDTSIATKVTNLNTSAVCTNGDDSDTDSIGINDDEGEIPDDLSDSDEDNTIGNTVIVTQGQYVKLYWEKRSKYLRHDVAIAAWMCSPYAEIKEDVKNYDGTHMEAVERVLRKWLTSKEVSTCAGCQPFKP